MSDLDWDDDYISKSQLKREAESLQELGIQLLELPSNLYASLALPDDLAKALSDAQKIKSKNAYRRQLQFIGRVMRGVDEETVEQMERVVQQWKLGNKNQAQAHKKLEEEREKLIAGDNELLQRYLESPTCDKQVFKQTLRQAQNEDSTQHRGKAFKKLFQLMREQS